MPVVTVLPASPAFSGFGSSAPPTPNGSNAINELSVAEIKERVKSAVSLTQGASALSLLRSAQDQAANAAVLENDKDLKGALRALLTASTLAQAVLNHQEFKSQKEGKKGQVWKEFVEFQQKYGNEAIPRAKNIEARLLELEKAKTDDEADAPVRNVGGSIAERMKSLQDAGLSVQATKRFSRDFSVNPPPLSVLGRASSQGLSLNHSNTTSSSSHPSPFVSSQPTGSSIHSFVSPASLGPPSPTSSTSSSPRFSTLTSTLTEFNQAFPSIDELDEIGQAKSPASVNHTFFPDLPSVPVTRPGVIGDASLSSPSASIMQRFPSIPLDLDPQLRPASTPILATMNQQSRPSSPSRYPLSPSISSKASGLSNSVNISNGATSPSILPSLIGSTELSNSNIPRSSVRDFPVTNAVFPSKLHEYMSQMGSILLLDVRTRDEFSSARIKHDAIVCLDPYVLLRDGLTVDQLEETLVVAPPQESALFRNRDKFDLVVMYDEESESFGSSISPMSVAVRVIYETPIRQALKRPPLILVGGFKAWRKSFPIDIARDDNIVNGLGLERINISSSTPTSSSTLNGLPNGSSNGVGNVNGTGERASYEIWSPTITQRPQYVMDQIPEDPSTSPEMNGSASSEQVRRLLRKSAMIRSPSQSAISFNPRGLYDNPFSNGQNGIQSSAPISYPQYPRQGASSFGTSLPSVATQAGIVSPPPQASINPFPLARRKSDIVDQSEQAVSTFASRPSIDYPDLSAQHVVRPPPAVATPPSERQDNRPRLPSHGHRMSISAYDGPKPPMITSDYPVVYWPDTQIATSGLKNLGNTCYMNATIQCLSATVPFARFFTDGRWKSAVNMVNPLGSKGQIAYAFANILHDLWHEESHTIAPYTFRKSICIYAKQFAGSEQHDSQEFLSFLLDGLHEDLNRILSKSPHKITPEREAELEVLPQQIASQQEWNIYRMRDDSIVVDFFQGQLRNRMECLTCRKTSTTYNTFMYLSLPIPSGRSLSRVTLQQCLDAFVKEEVMEKADAWQCPNCKVLRKATKHLSLSRLPPVLLIHIKRFTTKGHFTDKLETFVDFPLKDLDLTNYVPPPLPPGYERKPSVPISLDDPRSQIPPYRYDLYGVTNHFGTLSTGHYTAFIKSRGNWLYCDDSRITITDPREVVGKPAYVLYYKRVRP